MVNHISWNEFEYNMNKIFGKSFKYVDELYVNVTKEINFGEDKELTDSEALKYLQDLHKMNGSLYVITDFCYKKEHGPFLLNANKINKFVETFNLVYGESFYSTDIIIINFDNRLIWVLFHEGICWLSEGLK